MISCTGVAPDQTVFPIGREMTGNPYFLPAILSRPGIAKSVEKALHEKEIEPAFKLIFDLPEVGDTLEPRR